MSRIYTQIAKKLRENHLQSITLDIFDTVLLYRNWPEQQHDIAVAKIWHQSLPELLGTTLSPLELLEWRKLTHHELYYLHTINHDEAQPFILDYETWFAQMISFISERYNLDLDNTKRELIQQTMLRDQLQATTDLVKPNRSLIQAISELKKALPDLKVYFLSDGSYSRDQIQHFLDFYHIEIFDGGTTSVTSKATKQTGDLFQKIEQTQLFSSDFHLKANLHIGDNRQADFLAAKKHGSFALHYRPLRARSLRTLAGFVDAEIRLQPGSDLFGDRRSAELSRLGFLAKNHLNHVFLLTSSEADNLKFQGITLLPESFAGSNIITAPSLDQTSVTRALVWLLMNRADGRWNLRAVFSLIQAANHSSTKKLTDLDKRRAVYEFCFGSEYPTSDLILKSRTESEFFDAFLQDFATAEPRYTEPLREAYASTASFLPRSEAKITLVDTDPTQATAQLFREFAKLHGLDNIIDGFTVSK